jgi:hypothetical protein
MGRSVTVPMITIENDLNERYLKLTSEVWNPIYVREASRDITIESCGFVFNEGLYKNF